MTTFEYDLAIRVVIGLAGCVIALVAIALDWRATVEVNRRRNKAVTNTVTGIDFVVVGRELE